MIKRIIILWLLALFSLTMLRATAQAPDILYHKGKELALQCNPLESFLQKHPGKKPRGGVISSANWRGYVAHFEIKSHRLYLIDVTVEVSDNSEEHSYVDKSVLHEVFPGQTEVVADWFDGLLVVPMGKMVDYVHMGYGSTFEKYLLIQVQKGEVIREKQFTHKEYTEFRKRQFEAFKKTPEYRDMIRELKKDDDEESEMDYDTFIFFYHTEYTSKLLVDLEETPKDRPKKH